MCDPLSIAMVGVNIAGSYMGYQSQMQQYEAQAEMYKQNAKTAQKATRHQYGGIVNRIEQERQATYQKKFEAALENRANVSTARTAAGEGNVSGLSVDYVLGDFYAKKGRYDTSVDTNFDMTKRYLHREMKGMEAQGQSQINSVPIPEPPSSAALLVDIFGAALNGMASRPRS